MATTRRRFIFAPSRRICTRLFSESTIEQYQREATEEVQWAKKSASMLNPPAYKVVDRKVRAQVLSDGGPAEWAAARSWNIDDGPALRVLSHALTFPMTIARYAVKLNHRVSQDDISKQGKRTLIVYCAGARAESTLPEQWWLEALLALPDNIHRLHLVFIGPEVTTFQPKASKEIVLKDSENNISFVKREYFAGTLIDYFESNHYKSILAEYNETASDSILEDDKGNLNRQDREQKEQPKEQQKFSSYSSMIWLSNPGLGHPNLQESWAPSLTWLVSDSSLISSTANATATATTAAITSTSQEEGCPVLVTSHSKADQVRDVGAFLASFKNHQRQGHQEVEDDSSNENIMNEKNCFLLSPECSPFKSMRKVADRKSQSHDWVQANWGGFAFLSPKQV